MGVWFIQSDTHLPAMKDPSLVRLFCCPTEKEIYQPGLKHYNIIDPFTCSIFIDYSWQRAWSVERKVVFFNWPHPLPWSSQWKLNSWKRLNKIFIAGVGVWPDESEPRRCAARFWFSGQTPTSGYEYLIQTLSRVQFSLATPWQRAWAVERIVFQIHLFRPA